MDRLGFPLSEKTGENRRKVEKSGGQEFNASAVAKAMADKKPQRCRVAKGCGNKLRGSLNNCESVFALFKWNNPGMGLGGCFIFQIHGRFFYFFWPDLPRFSRS
jgi:hypothetical protein